MQHSSENKNDMFGERTHLSALFLQLISVSEIKFEPYCERPYILMHDEDL